MTEQELIPLAWDSETFLIGTEHGVIPPGVCWTFAWREEDGTVETNLVGNSPADDPEDALRAVLTSEKHRLITHNGGYDYAVACRTFAELSPDACRTDFHMGPTVQLDDFPYVHMMRIIDDQLVAFGRDRVFFKAADQGFVSPHDWGTLIHLVNEDYVDLRERAISEPASAGMLLMDRIEAAAAKAGAPVRLRDLGADAREAIATGIEGEARDLLNNKHDEYPDTLEGKTRVIEFARGGGEGSSMPLAEGYGYNYSLAQLAPEILERSVILYIWVTPEESRRKNADRADPDDPGSILHHGVPEAVMRNEYGCDDMDWLEQTSGKPGTVTVQAHGRTFHLPIARFDNRTDKTSFIRADRADWAPADVDAIHSGMKAALEKLFATWSA